ncbi:TlpA disulfide reductase family protein [Stenotrophomonas sp. 24(2023)]|uniref:TlpA family protein disulfide reductase n=1 Tax=Stenotrophomonas sp. 24(2023) TaxID=3068324 RepID=UPI0027DF0859|nr:TlpA disulfide reductase family protein [Stenotrophomonas sp. 24(2023)]WMJ69590.1 TlpA disulfide reductase family protein [Stenotrophomonas sp. 24(2023)]
MTSVGPVPMPVVVVLLALLLSMGLSTLWVRYRPVPVAAPADASAGTPSPAAMLLDMLLIGLLAGRISFVLSHLTAYGAAPWSMLQIADGGYHWPVVVLVAAGWALWRLRGHPALRVPVLAAGLAGVVAWAGATAALSSWQADCMPLPAMTLTDLQGDAVPLQQFHGTPVVLNLWASWCGPCRREMPVLQAAQQAHPQVHFVFANQGEGRQEVQDFLASERLALANVLLDADAGTSTALGVRAYPSTLFFDAQGRLVELHLGELTHAALDHKLRRLR